VTERSLSAAEARRIALAAQGFDRAGGRSGSADRKKLRRTIGKLGVLQLDSVNVLVRSHYLPAFSRLGAYDRSSLEAEAWGPRPGLFEYWGHEASLMPLSTHPLLRWRMARARDGESWGGLSTFARERPEFIASVLRRIEQEGPLTGGDFAEPGRRAGWWNWSDGKKALEWLFWAGRITTRTRRGFERVYDLTERVLPRAILDLPTPSEAEAHRALLAIASQALGVATAGDLRDYFRMPAAGVADRLGELVEAGVLIPFSVEGWKPPAYVAKSARLPRATGAAALLSPFDNLIWRRDRAERLFGVRIRLEIYTPAHRREHGYYVLPFLLDDRIVARVDLKADRGRAVLRVEAAHLEPGEDAERVAEALAGCLRDLAAWLGLGPPQTMACGDLSLALRANLSGR